MMYISNLIKEVHDMNRKKLIGRILIDCKAGCDYRAVLTAVGLSPRDLYADYVYKTEEFSPKVSEPDVPKPEAKSEEWKYICDYIYSNWRVWDASQQVIFDNLSESENYKNE